MKRSIEVEDTLEERVESAIEDVKTLLEEWLEENPDADEPPCLHNDLDYSGSVHEIIDGSVPIYTYEIETAWFLYSNELEQAYEDAGVGDNPRENDGMAAIYFYIEQRVCQWYESIRDEIQDKIDELVAEDE